MVVPHESDQRAWLLKGNGHIMANITNASLLLAVSLLRGMGYV